MTGRLLSRSLLIAAALTVGLLAAPARADVIHLNAGGLIRGTIVEENEDEVMIRTVGGVLRVFRDDIGRIERGQDPKADLARRRGALAADDAAGRYELARWAKSMHLGQAAQTLLEEVLDLQPNHVEARRALGYVLRLGNWVSQKEAARLDRERGEGLDDAESEAAIEKALRSHRVAPGLRARLHAVRRGLSSADPAKRRDAAKAVAAMPSSYAADELVRAEKRGVEAPDREALVTKAREGARLLVQGLLKRGLRLDRRHTRAFSRLAPALSDKELQKRQTKLLERWVKARDEAVKTIFDLEIYPDENHGRKGQPTVDKKVEAVTAIYDHYEPRLLADLRGVLGQSQAQMAKAWTQFEANRARIGDLAALLKDLGGKDTVSGRLQRLTPAQRALLQYRAGRIDAAYALRKQLRPWEQQMLERLRDVRVREYNDALLGRRQVPKDGVWPTGAEREQVKITNAYRQKMGRSAIEVHPCLVESARGHSNEMTRLGYFEHDSPVPENKTPSMRAKNAGYPGGAAENISLGSQTPLATHKAWYNSSGHHRNILGPGHIAMGSGLDGQHWTQNFGSIGLLKR